MAYGTKRAYESKKPAYKAETKQQTENKYVSKSDAEFQTVTPTGTQKFEPFTKIFAWKTTKRFGFLSLEAYRNLEQKKLNGEPLENGYEKWYVKLKTGAGNQTLSALFNTKKKILFFDMGTTKCAVSPTKHYFSFLMPEAVKNAKLRR
jgi:hypothetical protein